MRFYSYVFVLIVDGDTKSIEEANQSSHLPRHRPRQTLEFGNRHRCLPVEVVNLYAENMQVGLESSNCGADM